ncbi:MAG TPA: Ig-like domain-containing protein, partial [Candidatus Kapabacteria bacterium]|nr:Ig-like domain-containing protein [Candidatus Kapabacteria bacterium]
AINSFAATPSTINIGDSSALSWTLDGTQTSVSIDQGIGDQTNNSNDSIHVFPGATTTYTLTAKNGTGTSTKTVTVTVSNPGDPNSPPIPTGLNASAGSSSPSTINLAWIEPSGSVAASHFIIERRLAGQTFDTISAAAPGPGSYSDAQLYPSFAYTYRIKSVSSAGAASGWSNSATAVAPGVAPNIASITLSPANVPTLTPGGTQQFTATAFDQSGNALPIAQGSFIWTTSNGLIANVNAFGLVTAGTMQGSADIAASLAQQGDLTNLVVSNSVTVTVANKSSANTAVLFYGSAASDFTDYTGALAASGGAFDPINDFSNGGPPQFTIAQLTPYNRVVVLVATTTTISASAESYLAEYAALGGKTLVIIGGGGEEQLTSGTLANYVGVSQDGYQNVNNINPTIQGQSGTAFAGLTFTKQDAVTYVDDITLTANSTSKAALVGTLIPPDNSQFTIAIQGSVAGAGGSSQFLYVGASIDVVDAADQNTFVRDFMNF